MTEIKTERLLLRQFTESDLPALIAMGQDPIVMKHFLALMTPEETTAMYHRMKARWEESGFGVFAVEIPGEVEFAGFIGLTIPKFESFFTPCVEILWRLIPSVHGKGYCTEGAQAVVDWAFKVKGMTEIYSMAVKANPASWRVMEKIGMKHIGEFEHPMVPKGHAVCLHEVYKLAR